MLDVVRVKALRLAVAQEGSVDDADRREMVEQIAARSERSMIEVTKCPRPNATSTKIWRRGVAIHAHAQSLRGTLGLALGAKR